MISFMPSKLNFLFSLILMLSNQGDALEQETQEEKIEILALDVISYDDFSQNDPQALNILSAALLEKGIVGIKGVPGYQEKVCAFIEQSRQFSALPLETKEKYAPNLALGDLFLGFEAGKEKFMRPDGQWVIDDLKESFYAFIPDNPSNKWPAEMDLMTSYEDLGAQMAMVGESIMRKIDLLGPSTGIELDVNSRLGRMLYYRGDCDRNQANPYWCGAHFDHGLFTALLPAFYFLDGEPVPEPLEAGLFVRTSSNVNFKKVITDDPEVMLFQVGEFGQLVTNDLIKATEHRVAKAHSSLERYTLALFFNAPKDVVIQSTSVLTSDERYGGVSGAPCSYRQWEQRSFDRYIVK